MATAATTRIAIDCAPPIARITLSHSPLNVIDLRDGARAAAALTEIESRAAIISVVFLQGDESGFSAGVDVKAHLPEQIHEMLTGFHAVIRAIVASRKVTIAAVRGACLGGGAELAASATWFIPLAMPAGDFPKSSWHAIRQSQWWRSQRSSVRSAPPNSSLQDVKFSGDEAAAMGLATRSVRCEELETVVERTLAELRTLSPPRSHMRRKRSTRGMRFTLTKGWRGPKKFISKNSSRPLTRARVSLPSLRNDHRNGQANREREGEVE